MISVLAGIVLVVILSLVLVFDAVESAITSPRLFDRWFGSNRLRGGDLDLARRLMYENGENPHLVAGLLDAEWVEIYASQGRVSDLVDLWTRRKRYGLGRPTRPVVVSE